MELGLTFPLQRFLKSKPIPYGDEPDRRYCWDLHVIDLWGRKSLLAVHCHSRYTFVRFDLNSLEWDNLQTVFETGLRESLTAAGIPEREITAYLQQAGAIKFTRTHGRREVAFLNRAWEDVLVTDLCLDTTSQGQPLLDHTINHLLSRCVGFDGLGPAAERVKHSLINDRGERKSDDT